MLSFSLGLTPRCARCCAPAPRVSSLQSVCLDGLVQRTVARYRTNNRPQLISVSIHIPPMVHARGSGVGFMHVLGTPPNTLPQTGLGGGSGWGGTLTLTCTLFFLDSDRSELFMERSACSMHTCRTHTTKTSTSTNGVSTVTSFFINNFIPGSLQNRFASRSILRTTMSGESFTTVPLAPFRRPTS
jgi:hypothetical protein